MAIISHRRLPIFSSLSAILTLLLLVEWPPLATAASAAATAAASATTSTTSKNNPTKPRQSITKPEFSPQSMMPYLNFPNRPSFSHFSSPNQFPQLPSMLGRSHHPLYPNIVISYGPSSYGYNTNGFGNYGYGGGGGYGNYMFPSGYHHQPYLFDPYMSSSPYSPFGSYHPSLSSPNSFPNMNSLGGQQQHPNKPHLQQQQLHHPPPNHHPMMTPPFGFIDKQVRHTNNPADIANIPPPKAIMTTAADVIGLRGPGADNDPSENNFFDFLFGQDNNKKHQGSISGAISSTTSRRKPVPGLTYNSFSNKEHGKFNYNNNDKFITKGLLKSKRFGGGGEDSSSSPNNNAIKVKSINGTEIELALEDLEDDDEPVKSNFVSEPIMPDSPWSYDSPQRQKELVFHHEMFSVSPSQPLNIMPAFSSFDDLKRQPMHMEPMLFNLDDGKMENNNFDFDFDKNEAKDDEDGNKRVYHCPNARDLIELSQAEVYPDPFKCDQFYYCKWGKAQVFKCPVNHFFNPYLRACDVDEDFACAMSLKKK